ncbi:MAG: nuclear transport factor 2 family protein [Caldimonas sp.]
MNRVAAPTCALALALVLALAGCATGGSTAPPAAASATGPPGAAEAAALFDTLVAIERRSWRAWQGHDGAFFGETLADDHVDIGFSGPVDKRAVVAGVLSPACAVRSFEVEGFRLVAVDANTAVLVYRAKQDTTCGAFVVPSPTWVSSLYVKRDGRWQNLVFQQTQASP